MPSDDYSIVGGGALKLKGAKVGKKKKKRDKTDLEKNLATGEVAKKDTPAKELQKSEADREDGEDDSESIKTESEKRFEEFKRKRLLEASASRPELLKTHKERVEELNTYLSKLSEHHDMPKIGPG